MRREGYEVLVSRPTVITQHIDGKLCEPFETLYLEIPEEYVGAVMKSLARIWEQPVQNTWPINRRAATMTS